MKKFSFPEKDGKYEVFPKANLLKQPTFVIMHFFIYFEKKIDRFQNPKPSNISEKIFMETTFILKRMKAEILLFLIENSILLNYLIDFPKELAKNQKITYFQQNMYKYNPIYKKIRVELGIFIFFFI